MAGGTADGQRRPGAVVAALTPAVLAVGLAACGEEVTGPEEETPGAVIEDLDESLPDPQEAFEDQADEDGLVDEDPPDPAAPDGEGPDGPDGP